MAWVTDPKVECLIHVVDFSGKHSSTQYFVSAGDTDPAAGGPAALSAAVQGITTGYVYAVECLIRAHQGSAITPGTGPYDRVQDKMMIVFNAADGSNPILQLPTLNETILQTDMINLDQADSLVADIQTAMVSYGKTAEGAAITGIQRGFRRRPPRLKHH